MKKIISVAVAVALAGAMAGCGQKKAEDSTTFIRYGFDRFGNGVVVGETVVSFLDFDTMEKAPICAVPNCQHLYSDCLAKKVTAMPVFYNDFIYFFESNRGAVRETADGKEFYIKSSLKRASLDSSQIETVCEWDDSVPQIGYGGYVLHNSELYFIGDDYNPIGDKYGGFSYGNSGGNHFICSVDLDTGKYTNFGNVNDNEKNFAGAEFSSGVTIYGVYQGKIYMTSSYTEEQAFSDEDVHDFIRETFAFDLEAKTWEKSELPFSRYMTEELYTYYDENSGELVILSADGEKRIPMDSDPTIRSIGGGKLFTLHNWYDLGDLSEHSLGEYDYYRMTAYHDGCYILTDREKAVRLTEEELLTLDKEEHHEQA